MTEDMRPQKASNTGIIIGAIVFLCLIAGAAYMFLATSSSTVSYSSKTSTIATTSAPANATSQAIPASGTYLKLSISSTEGNEPPEKKAKLCASMLNVDLPKDIPHPVAINPNGEFIEVHIGSTDNKFVREVSDFLTKANKLSIHAVHRESRMLAEDVAARKEIIPGYITLPHTEIDPDTGENFVTPVLIRRKTEITGEDVKAAYLNPRDHSMINIELTQEGGKKMEAFTSTLTKNRDMIATVFNGRVINYATLNADSLGKHFVITGLDSLQEANHIIRSIQRQSNATLKVIEQRAYSLQERE